MPKNLSLFLAALLICICPVPSQAIEQQLVAGAGPSTKIAQLFFARFAENPAAANYQFLVPDRSAKHAGGIKSSDSFLFGRTGRPLNDQEKALRKEEIFLAKVPIAFATGSAVSLSTLNRQQLEDLYLGRIDNWQLLGGPDADVVLVGRESTEALFSILKQVYPAFRRAEFSKTFKKDHQVVNFLKSPEGKYAIGFGAKPNLNEIGTLTVEDFSAGVNVGLVYDLKFAEHPLVAAVKSYAASDAWRQDVVQSGLLPAD